MASRRAPPPKVERPHHTAQQKLGDIRQLERRIKEVEEFDPNSVMKRFDDPRMATLETAIDETLSNIFGKDSNDYDRYKGAADLDQGAVTMSFDLGGTGRNRDDTAEARQFAAEGKERSLQFLKQAVKRLKEEIEDEQPHGSSPRVATTATPAVLPTASRKIFIVHGHDTTMLSEVARVVEKLGFEAVVLHEQPNKGRTLIEKFEDHSETAGFAIVLLSPDDLGRAKGGGTLSPRARQNVVLELGYFVGKAGRHRVCALTHGDIEIPSDIVGVVFEPFDTAGAWKMVIVRELLAAGYTVDANRLWRP
jgi:predicted nucleotide-binding protein